MFVAHKCRNDKILQAYRGVCRDEGGHATRTLAQPCTEKYLSFDHSSSCFSCRQTKSRVSPWKLTRPDLPAFTGSAVVGVRICVSFMLGYRTHDVSLSLSDATLLMTNDRWQFLRRQTSLLLIVNLLTKTPCLHCTGRVLAGAK